VNDDLAYHNLQFETAVTSFQLKPFRPSHLLLAECGGAFVATGDTTEAIKRRIHVLLLSGFVPSTWPSMSTVWAVVFVRPARSADPFNLFFVTV